MRPLPSLLTLVHVHPEPSREAIQALVLFFFLPRYVLELKAGLFKSEEVAVEQDSALHYHSNGTGCIYGDIVIPQADLCFVLN